MNEKNSLEKNLITILLVGVPILYTWAFKHQSELSANLDHLLFFIFPIVLFLVIGYFGVKISVFSYKEAKNSIDKWERRNKYAVSLKFALFVVMAILGIYFILSF